MNCLIDRQDITVSRRGKRVNIRGVLTEQDGSQITIKGNLQPERNLSLIRETFGSHVEGAIKIYTKEKLRTKESEGGSDIILYNGRKWEVSEVRQYDIVLPHYKIIAILLKDER